MAAQNDTVAHFRRRLVEMLAFEAPFVKRVTDARSAEMGAALGVRPEVIAEAIALRRQGFRLPPTQHERRRPRERGVTYLRVRLWRSVGVRFEAAAARRKQTPAELMRSLLHSVLQTAHEPTDRTAPRGGPKGGPAHAQAVVSLGLYEAVCRRAASLGVERSRYVNRWIGDYLSGRLPPVRIRPVQPSECFDDAALYVLPVFRGPDAAT